MYSTSSGCVGSRQISGSRSRPEFRSQAGWGPTRPARCVVPNNDTRYCEQSGTHEASVDAFECPQRRGRLSGFGMPAKEVCFGTPSAPEARLQPASESRSGSFRRSLRRDNTLADRFRDHFSPDYRTARSRFLAAAGDAGADLVSFENPAPGPDGLPVFTDVALLGPSSASAVMLINSATHGVEGFCGSAALVGWLREEAAGVASTVRMVLVHAINPHGFAWVRRVTEGNVDLNRNFLEHASGAYPVKPEYGKLHAALVPEAWDDRNLAKSDALLEAYAKEHGEFALQSAVTGGQYDYPDGLFYGGREPAWSNRTFQAILNEHVAGPARLAFLDLHTGLGPFGHASLLGSIAPRMQAWLGPRQPEGSRVRPLPGRSGAPSSNGAPLSAPLTGTIGGAARRAARGAELTSLTVEFGTYPVRPVLRSLQADNWLHVRGDVDSELGRDIKADIRERLYPNCDDWRELVWTRSRQIFRNTVAGLAAD